MSHIIFKRKNSNFSTEGSTRRLHERKRMKIVKIIALALFASLLSGGFANAAETGVSPEAKAAFKQARENYKASMETYKAARVTMKDKVAAAKVTFESAKTAATTKEAKQAARTTFKSAVETARASLPAKPTKPVRPTQG